MFRFEKDRLQIKQKLGKGRFGAVYPYQKDPQDFEWAVKRVRADDVDGLLKSLPEIVLGFSCDHPRVVPIKGYSIQKEPNGEFFDIYMKLPRMKETLLDEFRKRTSKNSPYSQEEVIRHFYSIASGLEYLHSKRIYHGDIKPDNLLLSENGALKIADVGIAKHVEEGDEYQTITKEMGTYHYMAPEILGADKDIKKEVLAKSDIWSLGVVILELCVFEFRLLNSLYREKTRQEVQKYLEHLEGKYPKALISLLTRILNLNPKERPDIGQILDEIEKNFSKILDQDLLLLRKPRYNIQKNEASHDQIQALNQQIQNFEAERKQWREKISQLESDLLQQKQQHEQRVQVLVGQSNSKARQEQSQQETENRTLKKKIGELQHKLSSQSQHYKQDIADIENQWEDRYEQNTTYWQQREQTAFQNFDRENKQLKNTISQLKENIYQQKKQFEGKLKTIEQKYPKALIEQNLQERINQMEKELQEVKTENQGYIPALIERDHCLNWWQQEYQSLQQENETNKQRSQDLEQQLQNLNTEYLNYQENIRQGNQPQVAFVHNGNVCQVLSQPSPRFIGQENQTQMTFVQNGNVGQVPIQPSSHFIHQGNQPQMTFVQNGNEGQVPIQPSSHFIHQGNQPQMTFVQNGNEGQVSSQSPLPVNHIICESDDEENYRINGIRVRIHHKTKRIINEPKRFY